LRVARQGTQRKQHADETKSPDRSSHSNILWIVRCQPAHHLLRLLRALRI
jgi:hypothetical protein